MLSAPAAKVCQHIFSPAFAIVIFIVLAGSAMGREPDNNEFITDGIPTAKPSRPMLATRRVGGSNEFVAEGLRSRNPVTQATALQSAPAFEAAPALQLTPATGDPPPLALPEPDDQSKDLLATSMRPLAKISLDVLTAPGSPLGDYYYSRNIEQHAKPYATTGSRFDTRSEFHWQASNLIHKPLYFEDVALERHGQSYPTLMQPFVSAGAFLFSAASLPYRMELDSPTKTIYTLGYERPGNYTPPVMERLPYSGEAAVIQAAAIVSGTYLFP